MRDMRRFKAFVFDMDGTILDSEKYHIRAFVDAMREVAGYTLTDAEELEFIGHPSFAFAGMLAKRHGLTLSPDVVVKRKFERTYEIFRAEFFPGAEEFILAWRGRVAMALASNSPHHFVDRAVRDLGLDGVLNPVLAIEDVKQGKPDPEMLLAAMHRLGVGASETLVFEDSPLGIQAALAAGCTVVALANPGYPPPVNVPPGVEVTTWPELNAICAR
ncbi:MAG: hypothetical protein A3K19_34035 [Lentisphaerae bacterium RIFOXYB12_FULL_65_16]|nr:MAG: hypothetical protein A3K19_34035 [Lentisphaerae bacterium RIFOXYB12_FULL_65_16]